MSEKQTFILQPLPHPARQNCINAINAAPNGCAVTIQDVTRTIEQNAYQWPYLEGFSQQLQWPVNGELVWMTKEEWKDVLTCAFEKDVEPRLAAGFDGGVVMLGKRTSKFGKKKFAAWMEWLMAAAALKGVEPVFKNGWQRWDERMAA